MNELEERETEGARQADEGVKGPVGGQENKTTRFRGDTQTRKKNHFCRRKIIFVTAVYLYL